MSLAKQQRLQAANEWIAVIASCGRRFFADRGAGFDAHLSMDNRARTIRYHDDYNGRRISVASDRDMQHFTHGGTLRNLVRSLAKHVLTGNQLSNSYFWPEMGNGFPNPWGYEQDIHQVRAAGERLGIIATATLVQRVARSWGKTLHHVREMPDGTLVGIGPLMFTTAIYLDLELHGFGQRFCFKSNEQATAQYWALETGDQVPVGWIATRGERLGNHTLEHEHE